MGNKISKEGITPNGDITTGARKLQSGWRNMSPKDWHLRFSRQPQESPEVLVVKQPGDKITKSDIQSINETGKKIIDASNRFIFIYSDIVASYKKAKKSKQVSQELTDYKLPGDVKLTDFVDTYIKVAKMMKKANSRVRGTMTVEQLNEFNQTCDKLQTFNETLDQTHGAKDLRAAVYNILGNVQSERSPAADGLVAGSQPSLPLFVNQAD